MADTKLSALAAASDLENAVLYGVQGGVPKKFPTILVKKPYIDVRDYGVVADDNSTDESVELQAALTAAGTAGGYNRTKVIIPGGQQVYLADHQTLPVGVTLVADNAYIRVKDGNSFRFNNNSGLFYQNGKIELDDADGASFGSASIFRSADPSTATSGCIIKGSAVEGPGSGIANIRCVDLSSFYDSEIDPGTITQFDRAFYQTGSVQCYYNRITMRCASVVKGLHANGSLFNGNIITILRCAPSEMGVHLAGSTGIIIQGTYVESTYTASGIFLDTTRSIDINMGMTEVGVGAHSAIRGTDATSTRIRTGFGGPGDSSTTRLVFNSGSLNTSYVGDYTPINCFDGAISSVT